MASVMCENFNKQEQGILEHDNAKCHFCAIWVNLQTIV